MRARERGFDRVAPGKRYRMCERKTRFDSPHDAARAARRSGLRAYDCGFCEGYHLTSRPYDPALDSTRGG